MNTPNHSQGEGAAVSSPDVHILYIRPSKLTPEKQLYEITYNDKVIVTNSADAVTTACRYLHRRGLSGRAEVWDHELSYPRMVIHDIAVMGAKTVSESKASGPRFRDYKPMPKERLEALKSKSSQEPMPYE